MDGLGFVPEQSAEAAEPTAPAAPAPADDGLGFVPAGQTDNAGGDNLGFVPDSSEPQTSTLGAGIEGLAKGVAGPLATGAELGLSKLGVPGLSAEEQTARQEQHPYVEGAGEVAGLVGGAFIPGLGEYTLGSKVAEGGALGLKGANLAAQALGKSEAIGKIGATAIKLGIEGGLFHLSDNASKMILGQTDPTAPVSSFLAGTPAAVLMGGGLGVVGGKIGSKLEQIAASKTASNGAQFLADLGNTFDFFTKNPDPVTAATGEAQHLLDTVSSSVNDAFGGLKPEAVSRLTEDVTPEMAASYSSALKQK